MQTQAGKAGELIPPSLTCSEHQVYDPSSQDTSCEAPRNFCFLQTALLHERP